MSYLGNAILNLVMRGVAFPPPDNLYMALFTEEGEVVSGGYSRVNVTGIWSPPTSDDTTTNNVRIDFPVPTVSWGKIIAAGIFDATTGGNLLFAAELATPLNVPAQAPVYYDAGTFIITLDFRKR